MTNKYVRINGRHCERSVAIWPTFILRNSMPIKENLRNFYDAEAKKYASTRKKHWTDAEKILEEIRKMDKKTISILEFGCGSGRLLEHLQALKWIKIDYTGVDISNELLKIAKKNAKETTSARFICDDITNYVKTPKQESFDFIIGVASFQHIPTKKERIFLMKNFYRLLKYEGTLIITNRALSLRFFKKHTIQILKAWLENIISLGKRSPRDIMVPRTSQTNSKDSVLGTRHSSLKIFRFYHLFSLQELNTLADMSGFTIDQLTYIDQNSMPVPSRTQANNSFLVAKKDVFTIS